MKDVFELSTEVKGIAQMITGLSNSFDNEDTDTLSPRLVREALFGVSKHLERISADLTTIDSKMVAKKGGMANE